MKLAGKNRSAQGKNCLSATLSTTNPTWTDPGSNLRGERAATNRLSHGTALPEHLREDNEIANLRVEVLKIYYSFYANRESGNDCDVTRYICSSI
jgi:hypothetical protein